ncbi:hypothetical protein ABW19_dt0207832 [Dactylella cylindrospora]|nr:hypothetical protein ABW19_dt0207832 [Dactylella cylindrospora]
MKLIGKDSFHILAIADRTKTHIEYDDRNNKIQIWGTEKSIVEAKLYLMYLNKHIDRDIQANAKKASAWARIKAMPDERHRNAAAKQEKEREEKLRFKSLPPQAEVFPFTGVFSWPQNEINPATALGMNFESLDPIRMEYGVYITYSSKRNCFRVLAYDHAAVQKTLDRIYVVFCEIAARNRAPTTAMLVIPPARYQPEVFMEKDHNLKYRQVTIRISSDSAGVQCGLFDDGTMPPNPEWAKRREILNQANYYYIRSALEKTVKDVFYLRTHAKLRIHFGTHVLFGYKRPKSGQRHAIEEFIQMLRSPLTKGEIVRK